MALRWSDIEKEETYKKLPLSKKEKIRQKFFVQNISTKEKFITLRPEVKDEVIKQFFSHRPTREVVKKIVKATDLPMRGLKGLAVGAGELIKDVPLKAFTPLSMYSPKTLMETPKKMAQNFPGAIERAAEAVKPDFKPEGKREMISSTIGEMADPRLLALGGMGGTVAKFGGAVAKGTKAAIKAKSLKKGFDVGKAVTQVSPTIAGAGEGAAIGGGFKAMEELKEKGTITETEPIDWVAPVAFGTVVGGGLGKISGVFAKRREQAEKMYQEVAALRRMGDRNKAEQAAKLAKELEKIKNKEAEKILGVKGKTPDELKEAGIKLDKTEAIALEAAKIVDENPLSPIAINQSKRLFKRVGDALHEGTLVPEDVGIILKKYNVSPKDFAMDYMETMSRSGKQLRTLSNLAKRIRDVLPDEAAQSILAKAETRMTPWEKFKKGYNAVDSIRRAFLVSQMATAARNALSQEARWVIQVAEDAMTGLFRTARGVPAREAFTDGFQGMAATMRSLSPKNRIRLDNFLKSDPIIMNEFYKTPIHDVSMSNKIARIANVFNSTQEYYFRRQAFDAVVSSKLKAKGIDPMTATGKDLTQKELQEAVDKALELTFAGTPAKGSMGDDILKAYKAFPPLTVLFNPFPRFWANSLKFLTTDFTPFGYTRLMKPSFAKKVAKGDKEAMSLMSKATLGTLAWGAGHAIRNSKFAGPKWYQIITNPEEVEQGKKAKIFDARPFAPFSTYMLIGEIIREAQGKQTNLDGMDFFEGAVSINRIAGTGLVIVDMVRSKDKFQFWGHLGRFMGAVAGGFSVPAKTARDIMGEFMPSEQFARTTVEDPLVGPFLTNIPYLQRLLPLAASPTSAQPLMRDETLLRQFAGLTMQEKNKVELELARLQMLPGEVGPRTGDKRFDRSANQIMGAFVETHIPAMLDDPEYKNLPEGLKQEYMRQALGQIRQMAVGIAVKPTEQNIMNTLIDKNVLITKNERKSLKEKIKGIIRRNRGKRPDLDKEEED